MGVHLEVSEQALGALWVGTSTDRPRPTRKKRAMPSAEGESAPNSHKNNGGGVAGAPRQAEIRPNEANAN
jgi:hypothetical protein